MTDDELPDLPELPTGATILSPEMITKRMVWDMVPCAMAVDVSKQLGLQPASDDVEEMEHLASHARLVASATLFPVVQVLSQDAVKAAIYAMLMASEDADSLDSDGNVNEEAAMERVINIFPIVLQTVFAVVSELQDTGLLVSPMNLGSKYGASVAVTDGADPMETLLDMIEDIQQTIKKDEEGKGE